MLDIILDILVEDLILLFISRNGEQFLHINHAHTHFLTNMFTAYQHHH